MKELDLETSTLVELRLEARLHNLCYVALAGYRPTGHTPEQIHATLQQANFDCTLEDVRTCYLWHQTAIERHGIEANLECYLEQLHNRLDTLEREDQVNTKYGDLIQASPIPVDSVSAPNDVLRAIYSQGDRILVFNSPSDPIPLVVWDRDTKDELLYQALWYSPLPTTGEAVPKKKGGEPTYLSPGAVTRWNYAVTSTGSQDVSKLIPEIVAGSIPAHVVLNPKDANAEFVFGLQADSKAAWHLRCRELRKRLDELGIDVPQFRYDWLARLPGSNSYARVLYLAR